MKVWIDRCQQSSCRISWEGVASLVKASHRNGDTNLTQTKIDLAYGLKDNQESILINQTIYFFENILMYMLIIMCMDCCR